MEAFQLINEESFKKLAANFAGGESSIGTTAFENGKLQWHRDQGSNSNYEALVYTDHVLDVAVVMETNNQNFKVDAIKNVIFSILKNEPFTVPKKSLYLDIRDKVLNDPDKGLEFYRNIKENKQDDYDLSTEAVDLVNTGKYLQRRGKFDDAIRLFAVATPLCAKVSDTSYAYELTAECYLKKQHKVQAKVWYEKALATDPRNSNVKGMLGQL